jgi:hypothetical protein
MWASPAAAVSMPERDEETANVAARRRYSPSANTKANPSRVAPETNRPRQPSRAANASGCYAMCRFAFAQTGKAIATGTSNAKARRT